MVDQRDNPALHSQRLPLGYLAASQMPLASLALLTPLLVFHELSVIFGDTTGSGSTVVAYRWIEQTVARFGILGAAPAFLIVIALLFLHIRRRDPWTLQPVVPFVMLIESIAWTAPLIVGQAILGAAVLASPDGIGQAATPAAMINVAVGAGLYEELLFRLLLVSGAAWFLRTVVGLTGWRPGIGAVLISSMVFALYHDLSPGQGRDVAGLFLLYAAGGLYFGLLYLGRGFGITATTHALYDICVLLLFMPETHSV